MPKLFILLTVLTCMVLDLALSSLGARAANVLPQSPVRSIRIIIAEGNQSEFVEHLKIFADKNAFAIRVGETQPDGKHIIVQMWREDLKVIGLNPFEPGEFRISFYKNDVEATDPALIDGLIANLKSTIGTIPSITFYEGQ